MAAHGLRARGAFRRARAAIVAAALVAPLYAVERSDADSWWHLATGRFIRETGRIPHSDPFSYTMRGEPWTCIGWLADLVLHGAWVLGGEVGLGLLIVLAAFLTLSFVGLAQAELRIPRGIAAAVVVVVGLVIQPRMSAARPLALVAVLLAMTIWLLLRRFGSGSRAWLLASALLLVAWAPSHPSCVLLPPLAALLVVADVAARRAWRVVLEDAAAAIACLLLLVALPSGRECVQHALDVDAGSAIVSATAEWQLSWTVSPQLFVPVGLVLLATMAGAFRALRSPLPLGLGLFGLLLAHRFGRNAYEAMLLGAPLIGELLRVLLAALGRRRRVRIRSRQSVLAAGLVACVMAIHFAVGGPRVLNLQLGFGTDERYFGPDVTNTLLELPPGRTLHEFGIGGYLIWRRLPEGVFADGRNLSLYPSAFIEANELALDRGIEEIEVVADRWDATYALALRGQPFGLALMTSDAWVPLQHGDHLSLFVRASRAKALEDAGVPSLHAFRFVDDPAWLRHWYAHVLASPGGRARLALELEAAATQHGPSRLMGRVLWEIRQQDPAFADQLLARLDPSQPLSGGPIEATGGSAPLPGPE